MRRHPSARAARAALSLCLLGGATTALAQESPAIDTSRQYIIYGEDDRQEFYEVQSSTWRDIARSSVVALISPSNLDRVRGGYVPVPAPLGNQLLCVSAADCLPMCASEPYLQQPSVGECSGVLIDDDLVLTAGHCFDGRFDDCNRYSYVFDFHYEAGGQLAAIGEDDVYQCEELVTWALSDEAGGESRDYAVVKLDRPVDAQRAPAALRTEPLGEGDSITAIGYPIGLPLKLDAGGVVQDGRADVGDYFTATTDTFVGNSGSGMFDDQGRLAGHLVLGGQDFEVDRVRSCLSTVVVPDGVEPPLYEHGVYVDTWRAALCDGEGYPSERLCGDGAPPIKAPPDIEPGTPGDGVTVGTPKNKGCSSSPATGPLGAGVWLALGGAWLIFRRRPRHA